MGFEITFSGPVTTVYNIDVAAGAIVHIGGGSSNHSPGGKFQGNACPLKINKAQRTQWGTACAAVDHVAPEGWTAETFSVATAFSNNTIPDGLKKGDTIFYWKEGVEEADVPDGFVAVLGANDIIVIVPVSSEVELSADDDSDDADSSLDNDDDDFVPPTSSDIVNDDDGDLLDVDDDGEDDDDSPF